MATGPACFCPLEGHAPQRIRQAGDRRGQRGTRLNGLGKQATVVVSLKLCGSLIVPRKSVTEKCCRSTRGLPSVIETMNHRKGYRR